MDDKTILIINFAIWLISLISYYKIRKRYTVGVFVLMLYTAISYIAISLFFNPAGRGLFTSHVTMGPFILLWFMILISMYPILRWERTKVTEICLPNMRYVRYLCITIIILCAIKIITVIPDIKHGVLMMISGNTNNIVDSYTKSSLARIARVSALSGNGSFDILAIITNQAIAIAPILTFLYLLYPANQRNKWITIGLLISLMTSPLMGIIKSSRVSILIEILTVLFTFLLFRQLLNPSLRKKIVKIGVLISTPFIIALIVISFSRFGKQSSFQYERYFAESILVFNGYCTDAGGTREGNITAPLLKAVAGQKILSEKQMRWQYRHMTMDNSRFSTFVGDFVLDWGVIPSITIFFILSIFFSALLKPRSRIDLSQLFILFLVLRINIGYFQYMFSGLNGNLTCVLLLALYIFFKLDFIRRPIQYISAVSNK